MTLATRPIVDAGLDVDAILEQLGDEAPASILRIECACGYPAPIDVRVRPGGARAIRCHLVTHAVATPHREWLALDGTTGE